MMSERKSSSVLGAKGFQRGRIVRGVFGQATFGFYDSLKDQIMYLREKVLADIISPDIRQLSTTPSTLLDKSRHLVHSQTEWFLLATLSLFILGQLLVSEGYADWGLGFRWWSMKSLQDREETNETPGICEHVPTVSYRRGSLYPRVRL